MHALITSRLDYGNVLLYGINNSLIGRLQRVQNRTARLITRTRRCDHISPILKELHWLPINCRPTFKILLYTYKALNGIAPKYLSDNLTIYTPARNLRSQAKSLLVVPKTHTATYCNKIFGFSAAELWNSLPEYVKSSTNVNIFKKHVKTLLFKAAYDWW